MRLGLAIYIKSSLPLLSQDLGEKKKNTFTRMRIRFPVLGKLLRLFCRTQDGDLPGCGHGRPPQRYR